MNPTAFLLLTSLLKILGIVFLIILRWSPTPSTRNAASALSSRIVWGRTGSGRRAFPAHRRRDEIHPERGFHPGAREQVLLLARALPRDGAGDHDHRGRALRQHPLRRADGHRRHQRRRPLRLRHRVVRRLRHCPRGLVFEFEISVPRRGSLDLADDLLRAVVRPGRHPDLPPRRSSSSDQHRAVPDRERLDDAPFIGHRTDRW